MVALMSAASGTVSSIYIASPEGDTGKSTVALGVLRMLGLADNRVAAVVFGGVFDVLDIAAYLAGGALVVIVELSFRRRA